MAPTCRARVWGFPPVKLAKFPSLNGFCPLPHLKNYLPPASTPGGSGGKRGCPGGFCFFFGPHPLGPKKKFPPLGPPGKKICFPRVKQTWETGSPLYVFFGPTKMENRPPPPPHVVCFLGFHGCPLFFFLQNFNPLVPPPPKWINPPTPPPSLGVKQFPFFLFFFPFRGFPGLGDPKVCPPP